MSSKFLLAVVCATLFTLAVTHELSKAPTSGKFDWDPKTVPFVNLTRYQGTWYQISAIPIVWEIGCTRTQAVYALNPDGKSVHVDNKCYRDGKWTDVIGTATPTNSGNSQLDLSFDAIFSIPTGTYYVIRLADDYSYSVVSDHEGLYLAILSRTPTMNPTLYNSLVQSIKNEGLPASWLSMTPQQ
jgi:apolipoprotein D and lipocalin family protein